MTDDRKRSTLGLSMRQIKNTAMKAKIKRPESSLLIGPVKSSFCERSFAK